MKHAKDTLEAAIARDLTAAIAGVVVAYHESLRSKGLPSLPHIQQAAIRAFGFALGAMEGADQSPCPCGSCTPELARISRRANRRALVTAYREGIGEGTVDALAALGIARH